MIYLAATHSFPISVNEEKWWTCSLLIRGANDIVGFLWSEMPTPTKSPQLTFFQIHMPTGRISRRSMRWPVFARIPQLYYDYERRLWFACLPFKADIPRATRETILYEIHEKHKPWLVPVMQIDKELLGSQRSFLLHLDTKRTTSSLLYFVDNLDEVSDSEVYWATWRTGLFSVPVTNTLPFLAYCDIALAYQVEDHVFLFLCQRVYDQEPPDIQRGSGSWQLRLNVYGQHATLIRPTAIVEKDTPRIRDEEFPHQDLVHWLNVPLAVTAGPRLKPHGRQTCVAALVIHEPEKLPGEIPHEYQEYEQYYTPPHRYARYSEHAGRQHGGLFWFDAHGTTLGQTTNTLGKHIQICCCGKRILGTDVLNGRWRLWSWTPAEATDLQEWRVLPADVKRATVVVGQELAECSFWLIEEYEDRVRVSLHDSETREEGASMDVAGITLPEGLDLASLRDTPAGVMAYDDGLLLLALKEQQLHLLHIRS